MSRRASKNKSPADAGPGSRPGPPGPDADTDSQDSDPGPQDPQDPPSTHRKKQRNVLFGLPLYTTAIGVVLLSIGFVMVEILACKVDADELQRAITNISKEFPTQPKEMWSSILSVMTTVGDEKTSCPQVILLLVRSDQQSQATSTCLVSKVARSSSSILTCGAGTEPLMLDGDELNCGNCIEKVKNKMQNRGTVVIEHLENLPTKSAEALHFFCDEHDNSFGKAAYLLTMTVKNDEKSATEAAESTLRSLWPQMKYDYREAIIARITSLVVFVRPEISSNAC